MKIIIRNLARETTEPQLRALFEEFGEVTSCDLVLDKVTGKSKGFGFAEMPVEKNARFAIKKLNDRNVANSRIRVKVAEDKK
ncbi:MAG: RNA recognition motif domain-containing protein [Akkermansiaceae bacterium]